MTQPTTQQECSTKPRGWPTSGIRPAEVTIPLPRVGGVSYAFQGGFLIKDGKRQTTPTNIDSLPEQPSSCAHP